MELVQSRIVTGDVQRLAAFYARLVRAPVVLNDYYVEVPTGAMPVGFSRRYFTEFREDQAARPKRPQHRAATDIVDREGVDTLTIRRVAEACGLSPMGLYRHVRDKDDLLDRVVDAVIGPGLQDLQGSGPWDQQVAGLFRHLRRLLLDHPGVAALCVLRPTPVVGVARFYARMLAALAQGGFTGTDAVHAFDTLLMFTFGSVLWEIPRTTDTRERLVAVAIGDEAATQIIERASELSRRDPAEYFEAGLNTILDGLRASRRS